MDLAFYSVRVPKGREYKHGARERQRLLEGSERTWKASLPGAAEFSVPMHAAATRVAACPTVSSEKLVFYCPPRE